MIDLYINYEYKLIVKQNDKKIKEHSSKFCLLKVGFSHLKFYVKYYMQKYKSKINNWHNSCTTYLVKKISEPPCTRAFYSNSYKDFLQIRKLIVGANEILSWEPHFLI